MHPIQAIRKAGTEGEERDTGKQKQASWRWATSCSQRYCEEEQQRGTKQDQKEKGGPRDPIKHPSQSPFSGLPSWREQALFFSVFSNGLR